MIRSLLFRGLIVALFLAGPCTAEETVIPPTTSSPASDPAATLSPTAPVPPTEVAVGIYVNQIAEVDLRQGTYEVDFWLWFRWRSKLEQSPLETFELVGGTIQTKDNIGTKTVDGVNYANARIHAQMRKAFDVSRFPFDSHLLPIVIEESQIESPQFTYVADIANCGTSEQVALPGWLIRDGTRDITVQSYHTTFGDPESSPTGSNYSRFTVQSQISRPGLIFAGKLFWSLLIAAIIAWLVYLIPQNELDARIALGSGALFAAIATGYIIAASLPEAGQVVLADWVSALCILFIFVSLVETWWVHRLFSQDKIQMATRIDHLFAWVTPIVYLIANVYVLI